jgi:hypothetical protein
MINKIVFVVPYQRSGGKIGYCVFYTIRAAKVWGYRRRAKTGESFTILQMTESDAFNLR